MFTLDDIGRLERKEIPHIVVGILEPYVALSIGAIYTREVWLSLVSYQHIREGHPDIPGNELTFIPEALTRGLVIFESNREHWASICYQSAAEGRRFTLAIKAAHNGKEIFLRSVHRMRERQTKALLKRGYILRKHK